MKPVETFAELAQASGTDKFTHHGYHRFYPLHLESLRDSSGNILEIGVNDGSSIGLWKAYFPNAFIHGADIRFSFKGDRFTVHQVDQSDRSQLLALVESVNSAFLVVDDGSHVPPHQLLSFNILFKNILEPGGTYIIEDTEISYWRRGNIYGYDACYGIGSRLSLVEAFKLIPDFLNREFLDKDDLDDLARLIVASGIEIDAAQMISSLQFCHNCIVIRKQHEWEKSFLDRDYRSAVNVSR